VSRPSGGEGQPTPAPARRPTSEERNAEIRAGLEPLAPGERPGAVTVAAVLALVLAAANLAAAVLVGRPSLATNLGVGALLAVAGIGMLQVRYWAVLLFQAMLTLQIILLSLALLLAREVLFAIGALVLIVALGALFWKLVRAMARIQMPPPDTAP
jgi:hypothetical protein